MNTATRTEVSSSHLRAFALDGTRVALVPEQAVLLAGDQVELTVRVSSGQRLEIVEPGGTVAYAMRGGQAQWDVRIEVEDGGSLIWHGEPFVVAEGADVLRHLTIELGATSRVVLRETLVLGRSGEGPGRLLSRTDVNRDGLPVLVEELDAALGLGRHRVLDQVLELRGFETVAERPPQPPGGAERPAQPPGGAERPPQPPGGAERPAQPPGGAERPRQPPGGAERPAQPPGGAERPAQPPRGAERPAQPPGGAERPPQPPEVMSLDSGDRLHRWLGAETHASPISVPQSSVREE